MEQLIRLLHDGNIFKQFKYKDGLGLPNHLVVTMDPPHLIFVIRQINPMHEPHPRFYSVSIVSAFSSSKWCLPGKHDFFFRFMINQIQGLEIPKKKKNKVAYPHELKRYWLAFKLYEENLMKYQGPQPPIIGDLLIEAHQLLRLVSVDSKVFKETLFDEVPQPQVLMNPNETPSHASLSDPQGMPDRVLIYRVSATNNMEVLQIIYFMNEIIRHRLFDTPISPNDVLARIEKYAAQIGGSLEGYLRLDQDVQISSNNSNLGEQDDSHPDIPLSLNSSMMLMQRSSAQPQELPNLYRVTEEESYVGQFNDPKKAYLILDRMLIGAPEKMYFERNPTIFDEEDDTPAVQSPKSEEVAHHREEIKEVKQESEATPVVERDAFLMRPVPSNVFRPGWQQARPSPSHEPPHMRDSAFNHYQQQYHQNPPAPLYGGNGSYDYYGSLNQQKMGPPQAYAMPFQSVSVPSKPFYYFIPDNIVCDKLPLMEALQRIVLDVLTKDLKFQYFREEHEMSTENKVETLKTRFAVRMVDRNINFVICGDPDALRIYTTLEGIDLRYPLQVRREAVHKLVLELNQHITVGSFQLEERQLALPNIELVMIIHYCTLTPDSQLLRQLLKRLISLSMATMKDIGIKLLEQITRRPHNSTDAIEQSITQVINERRQSRQIPQNAEQGMQMTPQQEQHDFLAKFLQRFGTFVNMDELRVDADPSSKVKLVTNDENDEELQMPISIGGGFSTIELIKFQGRPAVMKTMKNTRNLMMLLNEYRVMRKMNFDGVPSVYGLFYNHISQNICLIMENAQFSNPNDQRFAVWPFTFDKFLNFGSSLDLVQSPQFKKVFSFLNEFLFVLQNIHRGDIAHCDLSPGNIIVRDEPEMLKVSILDFGSAVDVEQIRSELANPRIMMSQMARKLAFKSKGTLGFSSPEVQLEQFPKTEPESTKKVDIYSLGLLIYFLIFKRKLSDRVLECQHSLYSEPAVMSVINKDFQDLKSKVEVGHVIKQLECLNELLTKTLKQSAQQRPSATALWIWLKESQAYLTIPDVTDFAS